jgi:hypothetical protein
VENIISNDHQKTKQRRSDVVDIVWELDSFKVIDSKWFRLLFGSALISTMIVVVILVFNAWYTDTPVEALYVSGGIALLFYLLLSNELFDKFPQTIKILWQRKLLQQFSKNTLKAKNSLQKEPVLKFLQETRLQINSRLNLVFGFSGFFISLWLVWLLDQYWILKIPDYAKSIPAPLLLGLFTRAVFIFTCFVSGIVAWQIFVVGKRIHDLGKQFRLDVKTNHPDGCGGLSPIGDLCLKLAYCIAPFLMLIGAWLILTNTLDIIGYLHMQSSYLGSLISTLQILLLPFIVLSFLIFFFPIISIHNSMKYTKSIYDIQLDAISQKIHFIEIELLTQADNLPNDRRVILEENIDFLKRSQNRFQSIPTYPFRISHLFRLTSSQIIPIIGVTTSLIAFIKDLVK